MKRALPMLLALLFVFALGCGWETPSAQSAKTADPNATPTPTAAPTPEPTVAPHLRTVEPSTDASASPVDPDATPDPNATPDANATAGTDGTPTPESTLEPGATPTLSPDAKKLVGKWEFTRSLYKGREIPASETKQTIVFWLFDNGSAEMNVNKQDKNTQAIQWRLNGSTLTMTLESELVLKLEYDGTYLILEQSVFSSDDIDYILFEKTD